MEFQFKSKLLCEDTWLIEGDGCSSYLVKGNESALMIDNGYGVYDIRAYAETLIGMPVKITVNTHGHFDHAGGNGLFDTAYLAEAGVEGATTPYPSFKGQTFKLEYPMVFIQDGFKFQLGNRELEVISIPSHSPGDIALLDRKARILFAGDMVADHVMLIYQQPEPHPTIEDFAAHMEKLLAYTDEFDFVCWGHGEGLDDKAYVEKLLQNAQHIMAGNEGEPFGPPPGSGDKPKKDGKGPRPGDFVMYLPEYKRMSHYAGVAIGYDTRYVFNKR